MADLILKGLLDLSGTLRLKAQGGKLLIGDAGLEALVEADAVVGPPHGKGPPGVLLPPPPAAPLDAGQYVWIVKSINQTVQAWSAANGKYRNLVTQGLAMQGAVPTWPEPIPRSLQNPTVTVNGVPINTLQDFVIMPSGGFIIFDSSGQ
jgi:hypothetical protein